MPFASRTRHLEYQAWYDKNKRGPHELLANVSWVKQERIRQHHREYSLRKYGLTEDSYTALLEAQNMSCACCGTAYTGAYRGFHVDHDHINGKVRGLLCHNCNLMLGHARDRIAALRAGIRYLKKHRVMEKSLV